MSLPPEHDFSVTRDEWEDAVFNAADHFNIVNTEENLNTTCKTFPEAIMTARTKPRSLIYAVTASGRFVCCVEADFPRLLNMWALRMLGIGREAINARAKAGKLTRKAAFVIARDALVAFGCSPQEAGGIAANLATP